MIAPCTATIKVRAGVDGFVYVTQTAFIHHLFLVFYAQGDRETVLAVTEVLVRRLLEHATRPAVLFLNVAIMHKVRID